MTLYVKNHGHPSILHAARVVLADDVLMTYCGQRFTANGQNAAADPARLYNRHATWRECIRCAARVGHYDWAVR